MGLVDATVSSMVEEDDDEGVMRSVTAFFSCLEGDPDVEPLGSSQVLAESLEGKRQLERVNGWDS